MFEKLNQIITFASAVVTVLLALLSLYKLIHSLLRKTVLRHLFDTLKNGKSIANQAEVNYQVKCYVQPKFLCDGKRYTIKDLVREIKRPSNIFAITGKPASGKTTTMRYLYCRLSRTRKCVYIQMQTVRSIDDLVRRIKSQATPRWRENEPVIAFIDGVDEALSFRLDSSISSVETCYSVFLQGASSKIYNLFSDCGLNLDCVVLSLRPEFLESPGYLQNCSGQNLDMHICWLEKLSSEDIIKIFKSLRVLQRMDKSNSKRHSGRYPSIWEEHKYVKRFKKILRDNLDSVFYYPMFVRYAYAFMKVYEGDLGKKNLTPADNMAKSFKVLLEAALKWEFHIYYSNGTRAFLSQDQKVETNEFKKFKAAIDSCMNQVIRVMLEQDLNKEENPWTISRYKLRDILANCAYNDKDHLVIAHCILTVDDNGMNFGFFHNSFYEFYLAKYLITPQAGYQARKRHLVSSDSSKNLQLMYYTILCDEENLCEGFSSSIADLETARFNLGNCIKLQSQPNINIVATPKIPVTDILSYLPFIKSFFYCKIQFTREWVEQMISGVLDLSRTHWASLNYAGMLAPAQSIKEIKLQGMPLSDVQALESYTNLDSVDIRLDASHEQAVYDALKFLQHLSLKQIHIYTETGQICEHIQELMSKGSVFSKAVLVDVLEYSNAYIVIYQLKQRITGSGKVFPFHISFTDPECAFKEYDKESSMKKLQILTAVFELELDELVTTGSQADNSKISSVLWNGLSLAKLYLFQDSIDESEDAYRIYKRLEPYVLAAKNCDEKYNEGSYVTSNSSYSNAGLNLREPGSKTSVYFGNAYGKRLMTKKKFQHAQQWLTYTYQHADQFFSENMSIHVAINLYKSRLLCGETDLDESRNAVLRRIENSSSFEENSNCLWFLRTWCAEFLTQWKQGAVPPEKLNSLLQSLLKKTQAYVEQKNDQYSLFSAVYRRLIFENRREHTENAGKLLDELAKIVPTADETHDDRKKQACWIQYMEQRLYYLCLMGLSEQVIETANELIMYPYRSGNLWKCGYQQIIDQYSQSNEEKQMPVNKHILWKRFWY